MAQDSSRPEFWDSRYLQGVTPWELGHAPQRLQALAAELPAGARVLVPGCGSAHDVAWFARHGIDVHGLEFSPPALSAARARMGDEPWRVQEGDFFAPDSAPGRWDAVYERAFLCALPRRLWPAWAARCARLLPPGGLLAGYFYLGDTRRGPPFGTTLGELAGLLRNEFRLEQDVASADALPVFGNAERWQQWRRLSPPRARAGS